MEIVNNPHDKFIKEMLGNVSLAQNFLKHYLPDELLGIIQLETASPMKDSFITEDLQEYFSDLLFRVNMNDKEGYVCFLFEHKSYRQKDIVLQ